jgi:hypothetical protein
MVFLQVVRKQEQDKQTWATYVCAGYATTTMSARTYVARVVACSCGALERAIPYTTQDNIKDALARVV